MILIALGANLPSSAGAPAATLEAALASLSQHGLGVSAVSSFYESRAWPDPRDPAFVNAVARIEASRGPEDLMAMLQAIERSFGRISTQRNAPRPLDLDLLDYDGRVAHGRLELPHPRLSERGFVLIPLYEIVPAWRHPVSGLALRALIDALPEEARALRRLS